MKIIKNTIAAIVSIIVVLLGFRFVLKFLGASPKASLVEYIYTLTAPLLKPFAFALPTPSIKGGFTLEFTTLFALFAYAFLGYIIEQILEIISRPRKG
jgi:uncharacterized protein YggT (Ycf19 family)